jgi:hypothetical protein
MEVNSLTTIRHRLDGHVVRGAGNIAQVVLILLGMTDVCPASCIFVRRHFVIIVRLPYENVMASSGVAIIRDR